MFRHSRATTALKVGNIGQYPKLTHTKTFQEVLTYVRSERKMGKNVNEAALELLDKG